MEKLHELQLLLKKSNINALIFSTTDEYMSEYVPESSKRIQYLTGFSGSLAIVIIGDVSSAIFVDGRYTLQAINQVDSKVFDVENLTIADIENWLVKHLSKNAVVAVPSKVTSIQFYNQIHEVCFENNIQLKVCNHHLVDDIWQNRPVSVRQNITQYKLATLSYKDKLDSITRYLVEKKIDTFLCTDLSSIAWLLNLRGSDIPYNPFFLSMCLIHADGKCKVFLDTNHIAPDITESMAERVEFLPEEELESYLKVLAGKISAVAMPQLTPYYYLHLLQEYKLNVQLINNLCEERKVIKNKQEIQHMLNAHARDGAYLVKLFANIYNNPTAYSEIQVEQEMANIKIADQLYRGCSFPSIIGINEHGAIVHYRASDKTNKRLSASDYILIDCGAQYEDGTTDVTRTLSLTEPSVSFKTHYTQVLKGHINLANAIFPFNSKASYIDAFARASLWQTGLDYAHGTGHGVGVYGGVHDGGVSLSAGSDMILQEGMILSIEPGVYITGKYGIRLENLYVVSTSKYPNFLCFKVLTMMPFEIKNIDYSLLSESENQWLINYHEQVLNTLEHKLDSKDFTWLKNYMKV